MSSYTRKQCDRLALDFDIERARASVKSYSLQLDFILIVLMNSIRTMHIQYR